MTDATKDAYKEIDAAIEAMFNQGRYIERHSNLLKALHSYAINDDNRILDMHLSMVRNQLQQMKTALNDLREQYDQYLERMEAEQEKYREQQQAMCRG
jgi:chromosome segregation ATPase